MNRKFLKEKKKNQRACQNHNVYSSFWKETDLPSPATYFLRGTHCLSFTNPARKAKACQGASRPVSAELAASCHFPTLVFHHWESSEPFERQHRPALATWQWSKDIKLRVMKTLVPTPEANSLPFPPAPDFLSLIFIHYLPSGKAPSFLVLQFSHLWNGSNTGNSPPEVSVLEGRHLLISVRLTVGRPAVWTWRVHRRVWLPVEGE